MPPTIAHGKICYIEIPALDIRQSSEFYRRVFGWNLRTRRDGHLAFDDGAGEVSGTWVTGRPPFGGDGLLIYVMVDDLGAASEAVIAAGGEVLPPFDPDTPEKIARLRDPAGNVFGLYEEP